MTDNNNLYLRFAKDAFNHCAERPFLITPGRAPLQYAELDAHSGRMQSRLLQLGVQPGDRVIVQVGKSAEALVLYLACLRAGAIYIPLNTAYTPAEVEYFLGDAEPQVFVCQPDREDGATHEPERGSGRYIIRHPSFSMARQDT